MMHTSMQEGMGDSAAALSGTWAHSWEEDQGDIEVYRPSGSFPFPPSRRGRETLVFGSDGTASIGMPGPDDRQQHTPVRVTALGMNRYRFDGGPLSGQVVEVLELSAGVLRLRRSG